MITNTRALTISTLSPIHLGCDEVYEPSNFVIHDGLLHALDPADLAESLSAAERKQLATLLARLCNAFNETSRAPVVRPA